MLLFLSPASQYYGNLILKKTVNAKFKAWLKFYSLSVKSKKLLATNIVNSTRFF